MDIVDVGAGVRSSQLGFGCAGLSLADPPAHHDALLGATWDAGVRWYDVARSYAYGAAEESLGRFLAGRRDEAFVVTKFGIAAPRGLAGARALRGLARRAVTLAPGVKRRLTRRADRDVEAGDFSLAAAEASLTASLRALRTDRVDSLLLHEAGPGALTNDLHAWLGEQLTRGTILSWGVATTSPEATADVLAAHPWAARPVIQVAAILGTDLPNSLLGPDRLVVSHSVVRHDLPGMQQALAAHPDRVGRVATDTGVDVTEIGLGPLLLAAAVARRPTGVVLFSSRDLGRCAASARVLDTVRVADATAALDLLAGTEAPGD